MKRDATKCSADATEGTGEIRLWAEYFLRIKRTSTLGKQEAFTQENRKGTTNINKMCLPMVSDADHAFKDIQPR